MDHAPKLPVVLAHGLCGFDRLIGRRRPATEFFPGVRPALEAAGHRVLVAKVSPTAGVETRAAELKALIRREVGRSPVHVVGHSLGGLDARYMISRLGMDSQVRSLTTVGTPHRGSTFADWAVLRLARLFRPLFRRFGMPDDAIFDLTTDECRTFNDRVPNAPGVKYQSVAGVCVRPWIGPEWAFPSRLVGRAEGANDGVVSLASATWGDRTEVWDGDHLNIVNWPNRMMRKAGVWHDRGPDYARLIRQIDGVPAN
ncbi:MAG: esterase/lipase family protein [Fimbriiglobus sp.]